MKIIDSHLHLFDLSQGDYHWLKLENQPLWPNKTLINQNFTESDLSLKAPLSIAGFVHIEAGFDNNKPWRELAYLEANCQLPFKSIAYLDITKTSAACIADLNKLQQHRSFVGIRYIIDENAEQIFNHPAVFANLKMLAKRQLIFELQMPITCQKSLELFTTLYQEIPELTVIINHAGSPQDLQSAKPWQQALKALAKYPKIAIKCSGWEMIDRNYKVSAAATICLHCITYFGEDRVLIASNFPVNLFCNNYQNYWALIINELSVKLSPEQLNKLCYHNSYYWYLF